MIQATYAGLTTKFALYNEAVVTYMLADPFDIVKEVSDRITLLQQQQNINKFTSLLHPI